MINIVVTPHSSGMVRLLYQTMSRCCEVLCVTDRKILLPELAPDVLLIECDSPPECDGDTIYVLGSAAPSAGGFKPGPRSVAVVAAQNAQAISFAAGHHLKALTCGLSGHDTLTLSSLTEESALICLQREISSIGGDVIGPSEIPVKLRGPVERHELLMLTAVLLLCGYTGRLSEPL